jgi:hypothetical protein
VGAVVLGTMAGAAGLALLVLVILNAALAGLVLADALLLLAFRQAG